MEVSRCEIVELRAAFEDQQTLVSGAVFLMLARIAEMIRANINDPAKLSELADAVEAAGKR